MNYRWHSHKHCYTDASGFTCMLIKTKRGKVERRRRKQKQSTYKRELQIRFYNNKRKEGNLTPVSLSAQASFSFSYETLISSDLHKLKPKIT